MRTFRYYYHGPVAKWVRQLVIDCQLVQAELWCRYRSWKLSPGHWSAVNGRCRYYGYAMCLGDNGVWYACGIFAE